MAVHGCGGVGLSAIMIASAMGANVVAIDLTDEKLAFARTIGAVATVNASRRPRTWSARCGRSPRAARICRWTRSAIPTTCFNSIANLRRRGRHVQVGLMLGDHSRPQVPMDRVIAHELEILGSHGMQAFRYRAMMDMIETGKLSAATLVGKHIRLDEAPAALMAMDAFEGARHQRDHALLKVGVPVPSIRQPRCGHARAWPGVPKPSNRTQGLRRWRVRPGHAASGAARNAGSWLGLSRSVRAASGRP